MEYPPLTIIISLFYLSGLSWSVLQQYRIINTDRLQEMHFFILSAFLATRSFYWIVMMVYRIDMLLEILHYCSMVFIFNASATLIYAWFQVILEHEEKMLKYRLLIGYLFAGANLTVISTFFAVICSTGVAGGNVNTARAYHFSGFLFFYILTVGFTLVSVKLLKILETCLEDETHLKNLKRKIVFSGSAIVVISGVRGTLYMYYFILSFYEYLPANNDESLGPNYKIALLWFFYYLVTDFCLMIFIAYSVMVSRTEHRIIQSVNSWANISNLSR